MQYYRVPLHHDTTPSEQVSDALVVDHRPQSKMYQISLRSINVFKVDVHISQKLLSYVNLMGKKTPIFVALVNFNK